MTASERHAEKQILTQLDQKTAFLKNPKFVMPTYLFLPFIPNRFSRDVNNTASFGPLKQKMKLLQQQQQEAW